MEIVYYQKRTKALWTLITFAGCLVYSSIIGFKHILAGNGFAILIYVLLIGFTIFAGWLYMFLGRPIRLGNEGIEYQTLRSQIGVAFIPWQEIATAQEIRLRVGRSTKNEIVLSFKEGLFKSRLKYSFLTKTGLQRYGVSSEEIKKVGFAALPADLGVENPIGLYEAICKNIGKDC